MSDTPKPLALKPPLLMVVFNSLPVPYPYYFPLLSGILAAILFGSTGLSVLGLEKAIGVLCQCVATAYIAWAVIYSYDSLEKNIQTFANLIKNNQSQTINPNEWVVQQINVIYNGLPAYIIFALIAIGLFSTAVFVVRNPLPQSSSISFYLTFTLFSLITGFGGSTVFLIGRFMTLYANHKNLDFSIFQYPYSQFRFVGQLQLKFALITTVGYFFAATMTVFIGACNPSLFFGFF